jgi:hypothetical protein
MAVIQYSVAGVAEAGGTIPTIPATASETSSAAMDALARAYFRGKRGLPFSTVSPPG